LTVPVVNALVESYFDGFQFNGGELGPGTLLKVRGDLTRLPVQSANRLTPRDALNLQTMSRRLRSLLELTAPNDEVGRRALPEILEKILRARKINGKPVWLVPEAVPVLLQLLMH
jgi:hypothetical protein